MRQLINVMRQEGGKVVKIGRPTCAAECRTEIAIMLWRAADCRRLAGTSCFDRFRREGLKAKARHTLRMVNLMRRGLDDHLALTGRPAGILP